MTPLLVGGPRRRTDCRGTRTARATERVPRPRPGWGRRRPPRRLRERGGAGITAKDATRRDGGLQAIDASVSVVSRGPDSLAVDDHPAGDAAVANWVWCRSA